MKYLRSRIIKEEPIQEKWYHNFLAGLMLIMPSLTHATQIKSMNDIKQFSAQEVGGEIRDIINHVKENKKEYKNYQKVIHELEQLIKKFNSGKIDQVTMQEIAKRFIEESKDAKNPNILVKIIDTDNIHNPKVNNTYEQVSESHSYEEVIKMSNPETIYIDFDAKDIQFLSGAYKVDSSIVEMINDSIQKLEKLNFVVEGCVIQSSTDGQGLSQNLQNDLREQGYDGDNTGLSEIRNDKLLDMVVSGTDVNSTQVMQDISWSNEGDIDQNKRYNIVTLKMVKHQSEITKEVKEKTVTVFYKMTDIEYKKHKSKSKQFKKTKGIDLKLDSDRYQKCFFIN